MRCIAVSSDSLSKPVSDYKTITFKDEKFEIINHTTISKPDPIPETLKLMGIGEPISDSTIWSSNDKIYFFIVRKL